MSRNIPFRQISSFAGQDPQLALFEQAVATKLLADDAVEYGPFKISQLQKATCNARAWDIILCDPTQASFSVILPDPRGALVANSWIAVKNDSSSTNSITVRAAIGTIDGAASFVLNTARAFQWFCSNGVEWKKCTGSSTASLPVLGPDVIGTLDANKVVQFQNRAFAATAPAIYQLIRSSDGATWAPSYEGFPEASGLLTFPLAAGSADLLIFTVPASPTGSGRFVIQRAYARVHTAITGTGTVAVRIGTSVGDNSIGSDQTVSSATAAGTIFSGLTIASRGSAILVANSYEASLAAGATIYARATTTGTISAGSCDVYVYGAFLP